MFAKLSEYSAELPHLISRRQFSDRCKQTVLLCNAIHEKMADCIDGSEQYFCIDSKPIEVCRLARGNRCKMGRTDFSQMCDQFMIGRNYAKETDGLFARVISKISAFTILQYVNNKNNKPIGQVKYALI